MSVRTEPGVGGAHHQNLMRVAGQVVSVTSVVDSLGRSRYRIVWRSHVYSTEASPI